MTNPKTVTVQERLHKLAVQIDPCFVGGPDANLLNEAKALLDRCKEALEPFAKAASNYDKGGKATPLPRADDYRKAREVLTQLNGGRNVALTSSKTGDER